MATAAEKAKLPDPFKESEGVDKRMGGERGGPMRDELPLPPLPEAVNKSGVHDPGGRINPETGLFEYHETNENAKRKIKASEPEKVKEPEKVLTGELVSPWDKEKSGGGGDGFGDSFAKLLDEAKMTNTNLSKILEKLKDNESVLG